MLQAREKQKEEQVIALKREMESGMVSFHRISFTQFEFQSFCYWQGPVLTFCAIILQAQAMKEQAQLREEMAYQYKLGNFEVRITNPILFGPWLLAWTLN